MYKIKIEEVKKVVKTVKGAWTVVGETGNFGAAAPEKKYGYAPDREGEVEESVTIYTQEVEALDLIAVINAVNIMTLRGIVSPPDAVRWADDWLATMRFKPEIALNREAMVTWFANAIMAGWDAAKRSS